MQYNIKQTKKCEEFSPFEVTLTIETFEEYLHFHDKVMTKLTNVYSHKFHGDVYRAGHSEITEASGEIQRVRSSRQSCRKIISSNEDQTKRKCTMGEETNKICTTCALNPMCRTLHIIEKSLVSVYPVLIATKDYAELRLQILANLAGKCKFFRFPVPKALEAKK